MYKRIFLIVANSMGVGYSPDADRFFNGEGTDYGADTYGSLFSVPGFNALFLKKLGIGNIEGVYYPATRKPLGKYGKMSEKSAGKDTVTGHWELSGIVSEKPMPVFPDGFPPEIINEISKRWGVECLCNKPYSGTAVIEEYGEEHYKWV